MRNDADQVRMAQIPIEHINTTRDGLEVTFAGDDVAVSFSWFWLRDHGRDADSYNRDTQQRLVDTFSIPQDVAPVDVRISDDLATIEIDWSDAPTTMIPGSLLAEVEGHAAGNHDLLAANKRVLWDRTATLPAIPTVSFDALMGSDEELTAWLENIVIYGFCVVEGVPATEEATADLAQRMGRIEETIFGGMWMLSAEIEDHDDSAYSTQYLEPHTDSSYYHDAPGLQMFNCLQFDGRGGESILVDGFAIADRIRAEHPHAYDTLTRCSVPGQYLEPGVHLRAERPPFRLDAKGELQQLTFNNYDRAAFHLPDAEARNFYHAYKLLHTHVTNEENWLKIPLRPGTAVIFDNWRTLHGRMGYVGQRVFCGCYFNRTELESNLRVLQEKRQAG